MSEKPSLWPEDALFAFGQAVQRAPLKDGRDPAYFFPGKICGWYRTPKGALGFAVSNEYEPACIQIFPQSGLVRRRREKPTGVKLTRHDQHEEIDEGVRIVGGDQSEAPIPFSG